MNKNIGILGGDLRIVNLAKMLAKDGYNVYTYGLEKAVLSEDNIIRCKALAELSERCNVIISAIPFSKDGIYINSQFSNLEITVEETLQKLRDKKLIAGAISDKIKSLANENKIDITDLMQIESFTIMNIIPTVEGAIQVAMENTEFTIHNSNCLVLGFGRIGKLLCERLKGLGANVYCMARKEKDLAWIKTLGYNEICIYNLENNLDNKDIIFNTVPSIILDDSKLKVLKEKSAKCAIIELASKPGGVDLEEAKKYGTKIINAQGLPGKVAPNSAAKYIKETLEKILN